MKNLDDFSSLRELEDLEIGEKVSFGRKNCFVSNVAQKGKEFNLSVVSSKDKILTEREYYVREMPKVDMGSIPTVGYFEKSVFKGNREDWDIAGRVSGYDHYIALFSKGDGKK